MTGKELKYLLYDALETIGMCIFIGTIPVLFGLEARYGILLGALCLVGFSNASKPGDMR